MSKSNKNPVKDLSDHLSGLKIFQEIEAKLNQQKAINIKNVAGSFRSLLIHLISEKLGRPVFVLQENKDIAADLRHDLSLFARDSKLSYLIPPKKYTKNLANPQDEHLAWLIDGLEKLISQKQFIAVATPEIFSFSIPSSKQINDNRLLLKQGQQIDFEDFTQSLLLNGFEKKDYVSGEGDVAIRGGLVDIYPIGMNNPIRIEFWGNEIDSIREFNALSQRSIREYNELEFINKLFHASNTKNEETILSYLDDHVIFIIDTPGAIDKKFEDLGIDIDLNQYSQIKFNSLEKADVEINSQTQPNFNASAKELSKWLQISAPAYRKFYLCAEGDIHLGRLKDLVENSLDDELQIQEELTTTPASVKETVEKIVWVPSTISSGFILPETGTACITEHQVFSRLRMQDRPKKSKGITLRELQQLTPGDFVIHEDKGVGQFQGFTTTQMGGSQQDVVKLLFAEGDVLYVHMNYIHKIQKYTAQEGVLPKLTKLGSAEWNRKKSRVKKKIKDIARDLIKLYAKRKMQEGFQFSPDSVWQKEFEASFIYDDTIDQAKTTEDVKVDMESSTPMDRLVCGDVGFGKTEIAIRAAFKAVQDGKQVLVLVPTTILAQQHYMTFKDRFARYPVTVDVISRFRTPKQQKEIIEKTQKGQIDILIGTHRLLSKDMKFKDVGLLIIDEEQRFGVSAKEKLREMRVSIDTLTLTATPIPRTLNFSLMGARDLSVIETPPRNRLPVETEILMWDKQVISEAIMKEIERGGQVYFVNDRIQDLDKIAMDLEMIMPSVKIGVAHGQMSTNQLEKIMEEFIEGKYDVLCTTKIVESGLDIPNANTMFINKAQNFGLAELYQLRGRVGRTNKQAYCYLLIPPAKSVSRKALQRLTAIEEFTDLGSGFQLAMRDLEIRGAGNLLGGEQSGFIIELGFEMYQKILDEAVEELRHEEFSDIFPQEEKPLAEEFYNEDVSIEIDEDALLPIKYITNDTDRFVFYSKLYKVRKLDELETIREELIDRFGKLPKEAENLLYVVKVRIHAITTGFSKIIIRKNQMTCEFPPDSFERYYKDAFPMVIEFIQSIKNSSLKQLPKKLIWETGIRDRDHVIEILWRIRKTLEMVE